MGKVLAGMILCMASTDLSAGESGFLRPFLAGVAVAGILFAVVGIPVFFFFLRRLRRSERAAEYLELLSDALPCPIFIRELGGRTRFLFSSRNHASRFGRKPEEMVGRSRDELLAELKQCGRVRIGDRAAFNGRGRSVTLEIRPETVTGDTEYLRVVTRTVRGSSGRRLLVGIATDITEQERARRRLAESEHFLNTVLDNIPIGIFLKDAADGFRYRVWNRACERMFGFSQAAMIGRSDFEAGFLPGCAELFREEDRRVIEGGEEYSGFRDLSSITGGKSVCRVTKIPFTEESGRVFLVGLLSDISREWKLEEKQRKLIGRMRELIRNERLLNGCLRTISIENDFDRTVWSVLRRIGINRNSDRCFAFRFQDGLTVPGSGLEWVRKGIPSLLPALRNLSTAQEREIFQRLSADNEIVIDRRGGSTFSAELVASCGYPDDKGILLLCGVRDGERLWGVIGIDFVRSTRKISDADRETLRSVGRLLVLAEERRRRLEQIADGDALRRQLVENISIPLVIIDRKQRIAAVNRATAELAGRPVGELVGMPCCQGLCLSETRPEYCPFDRVRSSGHSEICEFKRGERVFRVTCQPIYDRNRELTGIFESAVDLTEIRKQQRTLTEAVERAEAADRSKSLFLAMMSHELRTPLNAVIGFSELLQDGGLPPEQKLEYLQSINFSGRVLLSQINDLLDLTKLEAGEMRLQPGDTDLTALVRELHAMFRQKAQEKGLRFTADCPAMMPLLRLDEARVRQILLNLLGNAFKFTERGSIVLTVRFSPAGDGRVGALSVSVADTGSGVSEEYAGKIFEPFSQDDTVRGANAMQGTGLGLAIARLWAGRMGGGLTLESRLGKGSTFTFSVPGVAIVAGGGVVTLPAVDETPDADIRSVSGCSILLIDDVRMNLKVLDALLGRLGCVCRSAESGEEALRMIDSDMPDWVFTDLWMPGMNGAELVRKLRLRPDAANLRIAIVTADVGADDSFPIEGADAILLKPVTLAKVRRLFALPGRGEEAKPPVIA